MKTVEVTEEFQIPGTDVILEAGDSIQITEQEVAGWIAMIDGKKLEIPKGTGSGEATSLYGAKLLAIKQLKVSKSKQGLLAIEPAY